MSLARPNRARAVEQGLAFLAASQLPSGAFNVFASPDPELAGGCVADPSVFPTALIAHSLAFCRAADAVRERACAFLLGEADRHGLWRHWTRSHPHAARLPPDLDDTSCAAAVLAQAGKCFPANRHLLLANRDAAGLFMTWIVPRLRWTTRAHMAVTLPQLRHAPTLASFFQQTSAAPGDVDAVVNANALHYLGREAGTAVAARHLLAVLRERREGQCDKWYDNPFAIWYFFSRALAPGESEAGALIADRIAATPARSALDAALAACSLRYWRRPVPPLLLDRLIETQLACGAWPRAPLYHGGRKRRRDGAFEPPHPDTPRWGSEELTTGFCIEALLDR
ncbi:MAG TPA: prenyltransferase/squalene oxidase repeat-containing protein [Allosphingosinicella sp.]|jgi:hypothetical protein